MILERESVKNLMAEQLQNLPQQRCAAAADACRKAPDNSSLRRDLSAPPQTVNQHHAADDAADAVVYYCFTYGPMVHPTVRDRRGVSTVEEQAAVLREHRLTFAFGGVASVVPQRGYDVHGIVMRCRSRSDWEKMQAFEAGYCSREVQVHPYNKNCGNNSHNGEEIPNDSDDDDDGDDETTPPPIRAYVLVMLEIDESKLELPIEKLPQERYLRLIAAGMKQYGLDEDYIQDQILGVPFVPSRKPDNYLQFPVLRIPNQRQHQHDPPCSSAPPHILPKITLEHYQRICREDPSHLLFIVGNFVILIGDHDPNHPGATWFARNGFGKGDVTFVLHQTIVDPDIPYCETAADITADTQAWAENHLVEFIAQCGFDAHRVMQVVTTTEEEDPDEDNQTAIENFLAFLRAPTAVHRTTSSSFGIIGRSGIETFSAPK